MSLYSGSGTQCCTFTGGFLTPIQNPPPCGPKAPVMPDCQNILGAAVDAILALATPGGATVNEILAQITLDCPALVGITAMEVLISVDIGARRGVLKCVNRSGETAYMVLAAMVQLNGHNTRFMRPICAMYSNNGNGTSAGGVDYVQEYRRCDTSQPNALDCSY